MPKVDFKELPKDGVRLEQLARELLLLAGMHADWTGQGPDDGRDLIATETATGPLGSFERRWLVSCKHKAHSGASVGRAEVANVVDDCSQANATGFLLITSTHPSAGAITKLSELTANPENRLVCSYWDGVELEKRLDGPRAFGLAHRFFPKSMEGNRWQIYNMESPSLWAAHYGEYFLYLSSRIKARFPELKDVAEIIRRLEEVQASLPKGQYVRPRAVHFDEKHEQFMVFFDYCVPKGKKPSLDAAAMNGFLRDGFGLYREEDSMWYLTSWDMRLVEILPLSERFDLESASYYESYVHENFALGSRRSWDSLAELTRRKLKSRKIDD